MFHGQKSRTYKYDAAIQSIWCNCCGVQVRWNNRRQHQLDLSDDSCMSDCRTLVAALRTQNSGNAIVVGLMHTVSSGNLRSEVFKMPVPINHKTDKPTTDSIGDRSRLDYCDKQSAVGRATPRHALVAASLVNRSISSPTVRQKPGENLSKTKKERCFVNHLGFFLDTNRRRQPYCARRIVLVGLHHQLSFDELSM